MVSIEVPPSYILYYLVLILVVEWIFRNLFTFNFRKIGLKNAQSSELKKLSIFWAASHVILLAFLMNLVFDYFTSYTFWGISCFILVGRYFAYKEAELRIEKSYLLSQGEDLSKFNSKWITLSKWHLITSGFVLLSALAWHLHEQTEIASLKHEFEVEVLQTAGDSIWCDYGSPYMDSYGYEHFSCVGVQSISRIWYEFEENFMKGCFVYNLMDGDETSYRREFILYDFMDEEASGEVCVRYHQGGWGFNDFTSELERKARKVLEKSG